MNTFPIRSADRRAAARPARHGFALVIVLAFVLLITVVLVAYFSRTMWQRDTANSSFNQAKADELARSTLDLLTSDLKQEIADPSASTATPSTPTAGLPTVYTPVSSAKMAPVRNSQVTGSTSIPNLIRISTATAITAPGVDQQASAAVTTGSSRNGRTITLARWNKPYLVPLKNPGTPADTTPIAGFTAPNWVYVTSDGGPASSQTAPSRTTIGRYAYAMYDESGLLDMNVTGYPADPAGTTLPTAYALKGGLAFANLTRLLVSDADPSSASSTPLLTQAGINNLVGWRNYASMSVGIPNASPTPVPSVSPTGIFPDLTFPFPAPSPAALTTYRDTMLANRSGFLKARATAAGTGLTDQEFPNRQTLINLALTAYRASPTSPVNFNPNALQYLGTFSRAVNAPSWRPSTPAGSAIDYVQLAKSPAPDASTAVNRDLANVRFANAATITHYDDDGNTSTYQVNVGDPLVQRRFSLARIAWLTPSGPATGKMRAIVDCFGLTWDATNWRWEYSAASTGPVGIKTLDQVARENREPNFFELLRAGILDGSLGRDPGVGCDANIKPGVGVYAGQYDTYKKERNMQTLQIGANIIDQFDADSYPTAIHLNTFGLTSADDLCIQTVYGIENLPYLEALIPVAIADPVPASASSPGTLKNWLQPQLWNPHQVPARTLVNYPSSFRVYAYGRTYSVWFTTQNQSAVHYSPVTIFDDGGAGSQMGEVYFNNPPDPTSPFYNNPRALTLDLIASVTKDPIVDQAKTPAANYFDASKWSSLAADKGAPNKFAGILAAVDPAYNPDPDNDTVNSLLLPNPTLYLSLQYQGPDGNYHPYNFMGRIVQSSKAPYGWEKYLHGGGEVDMPGIKPHTTVVGQTKAEIWGPERPDPRTDRFSEATQWYGKTGINSTMNPSPNGYRPPFGSGTYACDYGIPYVPGSFTYVSAYNPNDVPAVGGLISTWSLNDPAFSANNGNEARKNAYYADPDGIVRFGDNYRGNIASGDGFEMYHGDAPVTPDSTINNARSGSARARRPMVLNRAFRSVGEIGFAFRDQPFKSVDFWSPTSADAALLDVFSVTDAPPVVAGQINPGSATAPVLRTILSGTFKSDLLAAQISDGDAQALCAMITTDVATNGTYGNRADLASRMGPLVSGPPTSASAANASAAPPPPTAFNINSQAGGAYPLANWANKMYAEAPMRALVDVANTRTWNVMIDVVAQSGIFAPNASDLGKDFVVQGERRYWLHVAIDRFTGKVVDQQLEPVYD